MSGRLQRLALAAVAALAAAALAAPAAGAAGSGAHAKRHGGLVHFGGGWTDFGGGWAKPIERDHDVLGGAGASAASKDHESSGDDRRSTDTGKGHARKHRRHERNARLSNEKTFSTWAHSRHHGRIFKAPRKGARAIDSISMRTEDGLSEVYLLLRKHIDRQGRTWIELRIPGLPNGRTGWVRRSKLGALHRIHTRIVVDRERLRVTLYYKNRERWSAPIGVGKPSTPTPRGKYWIRELLRVVGGEQSMYGPYAFGTSAYSTAPEQLISSFPGGVVGMHGTGMPWLIPGYPSHGCIRLHNDDISFLAKRVPLGAPLRIR